MHDVHNKILLTTTSTVTYGNPSGDLEHKSPLPSLLVGRTCRARQLALELFDTLEWTRGHVHVGERHKKGKGKAGQQANALIALSSSFTAAREGGDISSGSWVVASSRHTMVSHVDTGETVWRMVLRIQIDEARGASGTIEFRAAQGDEVEPARREAKEGSFERVEEDATVTESNDLDDRDVVVDTVAGSSDDSGTHLALVVTSTTARGPTLPSTDGGTGPNQLLSLVIGRFCRTRAMDIQLHNAEWSAGHIRVQERHTREKDAADAADAAASSTPRRPARIDTGMITASPSFAAAFTDHDTIQESENGGDRDGSTGAGAGAGAGAAGTHTPLRAAASPAARRLLMRSPLARGHGRSLASALTEAADEPAADAAADSVAVDDVNVAVDADGATAPADEEEAAAAAAAKKAEEEAVAAKKAEEEAAAAAKKAEEEVAAAAAKKAEEEAAAAAKKAEEEAAAAAAKKAEEEAAAAAAKKAEEEAAAAAAKKAEEEAAAAAKKAAEEAAAAAKKAEEEAAAAAKKAEEEAAAAAKKAAEDEAAADRKAEEDAAAAAKKAAVEAAAASQRIQAETAGAGAGAGAGNAPDAASDVEHPAVAARSMTMSDESRALVTMYAVPRAGACLPPRHGGGACACTGTRPTALWALWRIPSWLRLGWINATA